MMWYPFASLRRRIRPCRRCGGSLVVGDKVYHWLCERCEVRKFSDGYRLTYLYAFRRLRKAVRNLGRELERTRLGRFFSTIVELLSSSVTVRRYPYRCAFCYMLIDNPVERDDAHGIGLCVDECEACLGSGRFAGFPTFQPCGTCRGRGWFHRLPIDPSTGERQRHPLSFPDRPIVPTKDAHFED